MPLVLTQNSETADGHRYDDLLGTRYEYPTRYAGLMHTGEPFVYYRGRRGTSPGDEPYAYIGVGVVGEIGPSRRAGRLRALIQAFEPFARPVPFKLDGDYLEDVPDRGGSATGSFFRGTSVRRVSTGRFERILALAEVPPPRSDPVSGRRSGSLFANPDHAAEVDAAGMSIAMSEAAKRWPHAEIHRMPHNNPGYDVLVVDAGVERYVEVKSTAGAAPRFHLSEGQRLFADRHQEHFSLLIVTNVEPARPDGAAARWRDGAVSGDDVSLVPTAWLGELRPALE